MKIAIGDVVRVHYHPPGRAKSFIEGTVCRVDVTTHLGRGFFIDVANEVFLDRAKPIKPGTQSYVFYERREDFPGRIEALSQTKQEGGAATTPEPGKEPEQVPGPIKPQGAPKSSNVIRALFGRRS